MTFKTSSVFRKGISLIACLLLMTTASVLTACVKLDRPPLNYEKRYYDLEAIRSVESGTPLVDAILQVRRLRVSPRFAGQELVYKTGESLFESDFYNLFFIPPADMLTQDLREWLDRSNLFSHVVDPISLVRPSYTLEGVVNALYGDFTADPSTAVVKMQFFLLDDSSPDNAILFSRDYSKEVSLEKDSAKVLIMGLNRAVKEILTGLEADLRKKLEEMKANQ